MNDVQLAALRKLRDGIVAELELEKPDEPDFEIRAEVACLLKRAVLGPYFRGLNLIEVLWPDNPGARSLMRQCLRQARLVFADGKRVGI